MQLSSRRWRSTTVKSLFALLLAGTMPAFGQAPPDSAVYSVGCETTRNLAIWYACSGEPARYPYSGQRTGSVVLNGTPREGEKVRSCSSRTAFEDATRSRLTSPRNSRGTAAWWPGRTMPLLRAGSDGGEEAPGIRDPETLPIRPIPAGETGFDRQAIGCPVFGPVIDASTIARRPLARRLHLARTRRRYDSGPTAVLLLATYVDPFRTLNRVPPLPFPRCSKAARWTWGSRRRPPSKAASMTSRCRRSSFAELPRARHSNGPTRCARVRLPSPSALDIPGTVVRDGVPLPPIEEPHQSRIADRKSQSGGLPAPVDFLSARFRSATMC